MVNEINGNKADTSFDTVKDSFCRTYFDDLPNTSSERWPATYVFSTTNQDPRGLRDQHDRNLIAYVSREKGSTRL